MDSMGSVALGQMNPLLKGVTNHILFKFITLYRERPVLWNSSLKVYGDRKEKLKAYKELLVVLKDLNKDATIIDVKKKINSLRTNFRKRVKDRMNASAEEVCQSTTSWMDRELSFLEQVMAEPGDSANIQDSESNKQEEAMPPIKVEVISDWKADIDDHFHEEHAPAVALAASPTQTPKRKCLTQNYCLDDNGDEDLANAKKWMDKLKSMRSEQKHLANKLIHDLLTQGEMGTLYPNTAAINEYPNEDNKHAPNSCLSFTTDPLSVNNNFPKNHVYPAMDSNFSKISTSTPYESLQEKERTLTSHEYQHNKEHPKKTRYPEIEDEFDVVGRRVAFQLRGMEERQSLIAEKLLSDVMFHGRLGKLDEYSSLPGKHFGPS